jgi:hypothetical protein
MHWNIFLAKQSSSPLSVVSSSSKLDHLANNAPVTVLMPLAEQEILAYYTGHASPSMGYRYPTPRGRVLQGGESRNPSVLAHVCASCGHIGVQEP